MSEEQGSLAATRQLRRCSPQATTRREVLAAAIIMQGRNRNIEAKSSSSGDDGNVRVPEADFNEDFDWGEAPAKVATMAIDSHVHVWSDGADPFPWAEGYEPPADMQGGIAGPEALLARMERSSVGGALVVQPINHLYDHSFVASVIKAHPASFKGMALANPTLTAKKACSEIDALKKQGFVGVRFNPNLWPEGSGGISNDIGRALFAKCGKLGLPVGVMCANGFAENADALEALMEEYPDTTCVVDHYGFIGCQSRAPPTSLAEEAPTEPDWDRFLTWGQRFPNCVVKASAPFRVSEYDYPYVDAKLRFAELIEYFGAHRVLFGTDSPFCLNEFGFEADGSDPDPAYAALVQLPYLWRLPHVTPEEIEMVMRGTAERLFGKWG